MAAAAGAAGVLARRQKKAPAGDGDADDAADVDAAASCCIFLSTLDLLRASRVVKEATEDGRADDDADDGDDGDAADAADAADEDAGGKSVRESDSERGLTAVGGRPRTTGDAATDAADASDAATEEATEATEATDAAGASSLSSGVAGRFSASCVSHSIRHQKLGKNGKTR